MHVQAQEAQRTAVLLNRNATPLKPDSKHTKSTYSSPSSSRPHTPSATGPSLPRTSSPYPSFPLATTSSRSRPPSSSPPSAPCHCTDADTASNASHRLGWRAPCVPSPRARDWSPLSSPCGSPMLRMPWWVVYPLDRRVLCVSR
ncbi:uncharacterized protein EI97DRAFT_43629 [Westerdykella ornata]|uniref:Uncharacterized protein n=1 Tax=Westerdykella ornata TaxID=318751 RepID=A0A6A6JJB2_WESOR|nr:uncharacterized protein EI97DRAFT_43629 [Westerdykella ornata]KAF2276542.1 hypothetical protein EI97DRAFT_43629 [Westerdykella ornata]